MSFGFLWHEQVEMEMVLPSPLEKPFALGLVKYYWKA